MTNVIFVNDDAFPKEIGGIKRVSLLLADELTKRGYRCFFIHFTNDPDALSWIKYDSIVMPSLSSDSLDYEQIAYMGEELRKRAIDVIINQHCLVTALTQAFAEIKKTQSIKVLSVLHFNPLHDILVTGSSFMNQYRIGWHPIKWIKEIIYFVKYYFIGRNEIEIRIKHILTEISNKSDLLISLSPSYNTVINKLIQPSSVNKIVSIRNLIKLEDIQVDLLSKEKIIIWVGRVGYDAKRVDLMMRIWKKAQNQMKEWRLLVIGGGPIASFQKIAADKGLFNIEFLGFCNPTEYYEKASIICSTSVSEGQPMSLLEGMSYGCVPISFNTYDSVYELISDQENGIIIDRLDCNRYAKELIALSEDDMSRVAMAEKAMQKVRLFSPEQVSAEWDKVLNNVLCG